MSVSGIENGNNSAEEISLESRLIQLKNFRDKNLITQEQYSIQVEKLLSGR